MRPRPRLVDVQVAALYTGRPVRTLYRWHHTGRITRWARAGRRMFDLRELPERNHPTQREPQQLSTQGRTAAA